MPDLRNDTAHSLGTWALVGLSKVGVHSWSDLAAMLAAVYSALLIVRWIWLVWCRLTGGPGVYDQGAGE